MPSYPIHSCPPLDAQKCSGFDHVNTSIFFFDRSIAYDFYFFNFRVLLRGSKESIIIVQGIGEECPVADQKGDNWVATAFGFDEEESVADEHLIGRTDCKALV